MSQATGPPRWWAEIDQELAAGARLVAGFVEQVRRLKHPDSPPRDFPRPQSVCRRRRRYRRRVIIIDESLEEDSADTATRFPSPFPSSPPPAKTAF